MTKKPPIGIEPRNIWEKKRIKALKAAIKRYVDADMEVPIEWVKELNEFCGREKSENKSLDLSNITANREEESVSRDDNIYDLERPKYFNLDTFNSAIAENDRGTMILRSAILASEDVNKNTLMLKNIAGIARNNGKDVIVLCSDERKRSWNKEKAENFTKVKDYVLTIKNNLMNDTVIANTVFILDFGKDSILNYDSNFHLTEDILFLSTISRPHNNYVYLTSNELFTSFEEYISKYELLHHGIYNVYQEKSGKYKLLRDDD